jgi:hypothetical protein
VAEIEEHETRDAQKKKARELWSLETAEEECQSPPCKLGCSFTFIKTPLIIHQPIR